MFSHFLSRDKIEEEKQNNEDYLLWYAAEIGDVDSVRKSLDQGDDPNEGTTCSWKPDLNSKKNIRSFPLVNAARNGHFKVVKLMMERCKLDPASIVTAIEVALYNNHLFIAKYLLGKYKICPKQNIGNINGLNAEGNTLIHAVINSVENVRFEYTKVKSEAPLPSDICITKYDEDRLQSLLNTITLLIQMGADINAYSKNGLTPLLLASSKSGNHSHKLLPSEAFHLFIFPIVINALLLQGADANKLSLWIFESPLVLAARAGNREAVKILLPPTTKEDYKIMGVDGYPNSKYVQTGQEPWYVKPMFSAVQNLMNEGVIEILKLLKTAGADFNYMLKDENPKSSNTSTDRDYLLESVISNIPPRYVNSTKRGPYEEKGFDNAIAVVRFLLENGANPNFIRAKGQSPLELYYNPCGWFSENDKALVLGLFVQHGYQYIPTVTNELEAHPSTLTRFVNLTQISL